MRVRQNVNKDVSTDPPIEDFTHETIRNGLANRELDDL